TFIAKMMQECHALVLPSLHEALPLVIIEAMASGRPVICTRCGGPEYMVGENTGVVVEPGQVRALADGIADVLCNLDRYDPQLIASLAEKLYSYEAVTEALTAIYTKLGRPGISS
ncbi:MAG: glycosyltransferase, partial [Chloroflexota bacterium]